MTATKGFRTGEASISSETAQLMASEILDYSRTIHQTIRQMQIDGCDETQINFENSVLTAYSNPNAPVDDSCNIFSTSGGGLRYVEPRTEWLDSTHSAEKHYGEWFFTGNSCVARIGTGGTGGCATLDSQLDLMVMLPYLKQSVCKAINENLAYNFSTQNPPVDDNTLWVDDAYFMGDYPSGFGKTNVGDLPAADIPEKMVLCLEGDSYPVTGTYHFYQILIPR